LAAAELSVQSCQDELKQLEELKMPPGVWPTVEAFEDMKASRIADKRMWLERHQETLRKAQEAMTPFKTERKKRIFYGRHYQIHLAVGSELDAAIQAKCDQGVGLSELVRSALTAYLLPSEAAAETTAASRPEILDEHGDREF
jgi:hypothetical protein